MAFIVLSIFLSSFLLFLSYAISHKKKNDIEKLLGYESLFKPALGYRFLFFKRVLYWRKFSSLLCVGGSALWLKLIYCSVWDDIQTLVVFIVCWWLIKTTTIIAIDELQFGDYWRILPPPQKRLQKKRFQKTQPQKRSRLV